RSPSLEKATTEGVVRLPSALGMTTASPPSMTDTQELVVPRSIPIILDIIIPPKYMANMFLQRVIYESVGHFYHGKPNDLIPAGKALLEHFHHRVLLGGVVLHMHHGIVAVGVEGLAQSGNQLHTQATEGILKTLHGHLHALGVGLVGGLLLQSPLQVIVHRQEGGHGLGLGIGPGALLFLGGALAVVVVLGGQAQVFLL